MPRNPQDLPRRLLIRHTMHLNIARPVPHNGEQLEVIIADGSPALTLAVPFGVTSAPEQSGQRCARRFSAG